MKKIIINLAIIAGIFSFSVSSVLASVTSIDNQENGFKAILISTDSTEVDAPIFSVTVPQVVQGAPASLAMVLAIKVTGAPINSKVYFKIGSYSSDSTGSFIGNSDTNGSFIGSTIIYIGNEVKTHTFWLAIGDKKSNTAVLNVISPAETSNKTLTIAYPSAGKVLTWGKKTEIAFTPTSWYIGSYDVYVRGVDSGVVYSIKKNIPTKVAFYLFAAWTPIQSDYQKDSVFVAKVCRTDTSTCAESKEFSIAAGAGTVTQQTITSVESKDINKCLDEIKNNLKRGSKVAYTTGEVTRLQAFLKTGGYTNISPTGFFGTNTVRAVKSFQKANGLRPTGFVGQLTRAKIKALTCDE